MASNEDLTARLAGVPLFEGLSKKELGEVLRCAGEVTHAADHVIVREGGAGAGFHLLLEGEAVVTQKGRELRRLGPGDYFGEIALIDGAGRSATVTTATPVRTLSVTAWNFKPLLEEHPLITHKLLLELCRRLRAAEARADA
jgi:CRP/FNR family cyclic AMP-dependent transcriptional regulator